MWLGLAGLSIAYVVIISGERYYRYISQAPAPSKTMWVEYLFAGWTQGAGPLTLNGTVPPNPGIDFVALDPRYVLEASLATLLAQAVTARVLWPSLTWPALPRRTLLPASRRA